MIFRRASARKAALQRRHEPEDGGDHGGLPGSVGVLRIIDNFAASDPVDVIAVLINFLSVAAFLHYRRKEQHLAMEA